MTLQDRLDAVKDIRPEHRDYGGTGTADHKLLFQDYMRDLRTAKQGAEIWWSNLLKTEQARTGNPLLAERMVANRWPVGAVGHKFVIGVIRRYWLACDSLNSPLPNDEKVAPEEFLLGWLVATGYIDIADFLAVLPYWPIGTDASGRWV